MTGRQGEATQRHALDARALTGADRGIRIGRGQGDNKPNTDNSA